MISVNWIIPIAAARIRFEARDVQRSRCPPMLLLGEIGPATRNLLGLPKGVKVVAGGYDAHCGILGAGITQATPQIMADIAGTFERVACIKTRPALTQKALKNDINSNCYLFRDTYIDQHGTGRQRFDRALVSRRTGIYARERSGKCL